MNSHLPTLAHSLVSPLLAQTSPLGIEQPAFDRLPGAPLHESLLLESPWVLVVVLVVLGLGWWYIQQQRGKGKPALIGLVIALALAGGVYVLSEQVQTPREALRQKTVELVDAIADPDPQTIERLLQPGAWASALRRHEREEILRYVEQAAGASGTYRAPANFEVVWRRIRDVRAEASGGSIGKSQINVVVQANQGVPTATWWEIDWDRQPDGSWRARTVTLLWIAGFGNQRRY